MIKTSIVGVNVLKKMNSNNRAASTVAHMMEKTILSWRWVKIPEENLSNYKP